MASQKRRIVGPPSEEVAAQSPFPPRFRREAQGRKLLRRSTTEHRRFTTSTKIQQGTEPVVPVHSVLIGRTLPRLAANPEVRVEGGPNHAVQFEEVCSGTAHAGIGRE